MDQAVAEAGRRVPLVGARTLATFIADRDAERFEQQQVRAVGVLAAARSSEARGQLMAVLAQRHSKLDAPSRRVSRVVADVLANGGPTEAAAAKAWRRSPAGLLSRVMGDVGRRLL